jgi:hypothetical protein
VWIGGVIAWKAIKGDTFLDNRNVLCHDQGSDYMGVQNVYISLSYTFCGGAMFCL